MAQSKKFGTFGGVFTPSLLTILGVIMYLRLPWIISQGGLYYTLLIIVVAHVVSITTGLSVSSIATDKKVEAGGNYYIISRSLGLPIGGTLGIALFVGLSFSISLYIIGFCESLLSVLEIPIEISAIRLYGSITLVILTIVIFISTSLAIKLQYLILAAVVISIVSIFMGGMDLPRDQYVLKSAPEAVDLFVLFGIFFPAVTGFTAGVQMSGDLKDPKKSIPLGTILAIAIGFLVYIGLAIFIALKIDAVSLVNDPNILVSVAWIPQLVIAGIWGATLSSALGSILGAPRILQATSADKVTPQFFKKGYGASNEPRRALLFTFLIAEAGILIGELNIIARIVSIFFISTYGLINLSYAIEVWSSTDFRPSFKVPIWVGIIGALSSAIIMFELDVLAFIAATLVLGSLYLFLKKKELTLESGDTWSSFWSSVVRSGLHRLNEEVLQNRNWRPNILLFRGPPNSRTHLLDFGKWLVGNNGILSDFELLEKPDGKIQFTKAGQLVRGEEQFDDGIFKRRYECTDIYTGINAVSQFYGFSGVEPNTIILGWPKKTKQPEMLLQLLKKLKTLDYNILLLDKDSEKSFGSFETIDLWWRGGSNNASLAMTLMRFLQSAKEWTKAELRIFIIVEESALINKVHRNMDHLLKELRQNAEIRIINNAIEKRGFQEIMKVESANTDLTIIGLPNLENIDGNSFVNNTNSFIQDLNSVLLISASSIFEPYFIGIERTAIEKTKTTIKQIQHDYSNLELPANEVLAKKLKTIYKDVLNSIEEFYRAYISEIEHEFISIGEGIKAVAEHNFQLAEKKAKTLNPYRSARLLAHIKSDILYNSLQILNTFNENNLTKIEVNLEQGIENLLARNKEILDNSPALQTIYFEPKDLSISYSDPLSVKILKAKKLIRNRFFKTEIRIQAKLQPLIKFYINGFLVKEFYKQIGQIGVIGYTIISDLQKTLSHLFDILKNLELEIQKSSAISNKQFVAAQLEMTNLFIGFENQINLKFKNELQNFLSLSQQTFQELITHFDNINVNHVIKEKYTLKKPQLVASNFQQLPSKLTRNLNWMISFAGMELILEDLKNRIKTILRKWMEQLNTSVYIEINGHLQKIQKVFTNPKIKTENKTALDIFTAGTDRLRKIEVNSSSILQDVQKLISDLPESVDVISEQSFQSLTTNQFEEQEIVTVYLRRLIGYLIDTEFFIELNEKVETFNKELQIFFSRIEDIQSLLSTGLDSSVETDSEFGEKTDIDFIIQSGSERLSEVNKELVESFSELTQFSNEKMQSTFDKMNPYLITHSTNKLKQYIFSHEQKLVLTRIESAKHKVNHLFQALVVKLQYSQSEGILFARKLNRLETNNKSKIDRLITLSNQHSPQKDVAKILPRYYRQLFTGSHAISRQFIVSRQVALKEAGRIIQNYNEGYKGALLISDNPSSGKTTLSTMIAGRYFDKQKTFRVNAAQGGSIDPELFRNKINQATQKQGTLEQVFSGLPHNSVIILNDLEMWWQRSENGFNVIDIVLNLIDSYAYKTLFIININKFAYNLINKLKNIEDSFVGIISDNAFNAKEIQTAILQRHRSTGIKFQLDKHAEDKISDYRLAALFNKIFTYSNGLIGVALKTWSSMISAYDGDVINLNKIEKPNLSTLSDLPQQWLIWLVEFILHRQLTVERLISVFESDENSVKHMVEALLRSGFIVEENQAFKINPFLEHLFLEEFVDMGLLWNN